MFASSLALIQHFLSPFFWAFRDVSRVPSSIFFLPPSPCCSICSLVRQFPLVVISTVHLPSSFSSFLPFSLFRFFSASYLAHRCSPASHAIVIGLIYLNSLSPSPTSSILRCSKPNRTHITHPTHRPHFANLTTQSNPSMLRLKLERLYSHWRLPSPRFN